MGPETGANGGRSRASRIAMGSVVGALIAVGIWIGTRREGDIGVGPQAAPTTEPVTTGASEVPVAEPIRGQVTSPAPQVPAPALRVRTIDSAGAPVPGTVVRLTTQFREGTLAIEDLAPSDADGFASLARLSAQVERAHVRALLAGGEGMPAWVDRHADPHVPIEVVVPDFGAMEVTVLDVDGIPFTPVDEDCLVVVVPIGSESATVVRGVNAARVGPEGRTVLPRVMCGAELELRLVGSWFFEQPASGPPRPGATVSVTLRPPATARVLAGRLVTESGASIEGPVRVRISTPGTGYSGSVARVGLGRFRIWVPERLGARPRVRLAHVDASEREHSVEFEFERPLRPGVNDVGDVTLRPTPLLAGGRLRADAGIDRSRLNLSFQVQRSQDGEWEALPDVHVRFEGENFVAHANPHHDAMAYRLFARGAGVAVVPVGFRPGATDLQLRAVARGAVVAELRGDGDALRGLRCRLTPRDTAARSEDPWIAARPDGIAVTWRGLATGAHRLTIGCPGLEPVVDFDVAVSAAGTTDDPRLRDIDLRGRVRPIRVRVPDAAALPPGFEAQVVIRGEPTASAVWHGIGISRTTGVGTMVLSRPADLLVVAAGRRGVVLPGVFDDVTVSLDPAPEIPVTCPPLDALPAGVSAALRQTPMGFDAGYPEVAIERSVGTWSGRLDRLLAPAADLAWSGQLRVTILSPLPTVFSAVLHLRGQTRVVPLLPPSIAPASLRAGTTLALDIDPAALRAALAGLQDR